MNLKNKIRLWWNTKLFVRTTFFPLQNNIYAIRLKNGKYSYVHIPDEKELQFPISYARYAVNHNITDNTVKVDEEKIKQKKKDWLDENEDKDPEELV